VHGHTFAPLGPCLVTRDEIPNPDKLGIRTILNGQAVQDWNTDDMIFDVPAIIEFLSGSTTVWLTPGDTVSIKIDGIGALANPVVQEKPRA
jgi:2-keto-4-pentenoate hydratase/2-oxohepta-3-ene-1,7-dioic acid hydratase in catechol pathway